MLVEDYLNEQVRLHNLLNSEDCPEDIDDQYQKLFGVKNIKEQNDLIFQRGEQYLSPHDSVIKKINFLKNGRLTLDFKFKAFVYEDRMEIGYRDVRVLIDPSKVGKLKAKKGDIIFSCIFDGKKMGLITLNNFSNHSIDVIEYENLTVSLGDFYPREQKKSLVRNKRRA